MRQILSRLFLGLTVATILIQPLIWSDVRSQRSEVVDTSANIQEDKTYKAATFRIVCGDSIGSAFAISPSLVVTCYHVVEQADKSICRVATLTSGTGQVVRAVVIAVDKPRDLALLEISVTVPIFYRLADREAVIGERVATIKSRPEYIAKFSRGEVEELSSDMDDLKDTGSLTIRVDFGNSGSPLVNSKYEIVGIVRALFLDSKKGIYGGVGNIRELLRTNGILLP